MKNLYQDYCSENVKNSPNALDSYEVKDGVQPMEHMVTSFEQNGSFVLKGNAAQYYESTDASADNSSAFLKEISTLHERLEGLEINRDQVNYCSGLVQDGDDGQWT